MLQKRNLLGGVNNNNKNNGNTTTIDKVDDNTNKTIIMIRIKIIIMIIRMITLTIIIISMLMMNHIVLHYKCLAQNKFKKKWYEKVAAIFQWKLCKKHGLEYVDKSYDHD